MIENERKGFMMEHYKVKQIYPWLYSIEEMGVFCYLIIGHERAILFDAAFGVMNLREVIEGLTDKPYTVLLGHGHIDHVNAAPQFNSVFLHEADYEVYQEHSSLDYRKNVLEMFKSSGQNLPEDYDIDGYINQKQSDINSLSVGMEFDLGNLTVEVIDMAGHTAGSVGLLVREHSVLLTSDSANSHIWMFLDESLPLRDYIKMLERVLSLPFNVFLCGHSDEPTDKAVFRKYLTVAKNADVAKSKPYDMFGLNGWIYGEDGVEIVFNPDKM